MLPKYQLYSSDFSSPLVKSRAPQFQRRSQDLCSIEISSKRLVEEMLPTRAKRITCVGRQRARAHCDYSAAIPLKPTAAVKPGISPTSASVPLDWMAKTPTVPTIALSE